jgi:hypothetical protein
MSLSALLDASCYMELVFLTAIILDLPYSLNVN